MNNKKYISIDEAKEFRQLTQDHIFHIVRVCDTSKAFVMSVLQAQTNIVTPSGKQVYDMAREMLKTFS